MTFTAAIAVTPAQDLPPVASSTFAAISATVPVDDVPDVLVGPSSGVEVGRLLSGVDGSTLASGYPFGPAFAGGVRVASGDVNGDGIPDPIAGAGPGGTYVQVYNGSDISVIVGGQPFGPDFNGGVYVAAGDLDNDGRADIIVGQGEGGGAVAVFRADASVIATVTPFGVGYTGGVRVASGDVTGDGVDDLLAAQAIGGLVTIINGATGTPVVSAAPYGLIPGGVFVAAGDITGDDVDDVIVSPGSGNAPVLLFDLRNGQAIGNLTAYAPGFTAGVRVAAADLTGDRRAEIIVAPGPGSQPLLRVFDGATLAPIAEMLAYEATFTGGVFVASVDAPRPPTFTSAAAATFQAGEADTFTVTTAGRPAITSITSTGTLPGGVTFTDRGDGTAVIAGAPPAGTSAVFPLTLTATNRAGVSVVQNFSLTVESRCPVITVAPTTLPEATAGEPWSTQFTQSGATAPVTWTISGSVPAGLTLAPATGNLSGTPGGDTVGTYAFTVAAATDDGCSGSATVTLIVGANDAPTVANATIAYDTIGNTQLHVAGAARPGVTARIDGPGILAKSGAADGDGPAPLSVVPQTDVATPHGVVSVAADGSFSYVPTLGYTGVDTFVAEVTDSRLSIPVTVNVTVASRVWYVNNRVDANNAAGGDGRSTDAFETLAAAEAASADNDIIFVFVGDTATTPLTGGIELKSGQQLIGEHVGLTIGASTLVAPSAARPSVAVDNRAAVLVAAGEAAGDRTDIAVRGLDLRASNAQAVVLATTGDGANLGMTVNSNRLRGQGVGAGSGLFVQHDSTGVSVVSVHDNIVSDVSGGIGLTGQGGTLYVTALRNNTIVGASAYGIAVLNAIFDAVPGGTYDLVDGGETVIGAVDSAPAVAGLMILEASGALAFRDLRTWANGPPQVLPSAALSVAGTGSYTGASGMSLAIAGGSVSSVGTAGVGLRDVTADVHLASIDVQGAPVGFLLDDVSGVFAAAGGAIEATIGGASVSIRGGTADVTYGGSISDADGQLVDITGMLGGTMLFTGPIDDGIQGTGGGIAIQNNSGGTVTFAGGLRLSTADLTAFNVLDGGTVNVCATQSCAPDGAPLVNTLETTTGRALQVRNSTIGAHHLTFRSITAGNGSTEAVVLDQTGASGGLHVTGTGTAGSGGTITGRNGAFYLSDTRDVSLNWMALRDYGIVGVAARNTHNFELRNSVVASTMAIVPEASSLMFAQLTGNVTIENTSISGGVKSNISVQNSTGTLDRLTLSNVTVGDNSASLGADAVELVASGTETTMNVTVENSVFTAARGRLFAFSMNGAAGDLVFSGNTLSNEHDVATRLTDRGHVLVESVGTPAPLTYTISGNTFRDAILSAVTVRKGANEAAVSGNIRENIFGVAGVAGSGSSAGSAIFLQSSGLGSLAVGVYGNTIRQYGESGIRVVASGEGGPASGTVRLMLTDNIVTEPAAAGSGLSIDAGGIANDSFVVCAFVNANDLSNGGGASSVDLVLRQNHDTTIGLLGYQSAPTDVAAVRASLLAQANSFDSQEIVASGSGGGFVDASSIPACAPPQP